MHLARNLKRCPKRVSGCQSVCVNQLVGAHRPTQPGATPPIDRDRPNTVKFRPSNAVVSDACKIAPKRLKISNCDSYTIQTSGWLTERIVNTVKIY